MKTFLAAYEHYLENEKHASANTVASYMRDLRQFASYADDRQLKVRDITQSNVSTYLDYLAGQGKSPATVSRSLASLKGFFTYLVGEAVIDRNPALHVATVKAEKKLPQVLTGKEVERLLAQPKCSDMKGYRDKAMLELLYATGIRVTELISLNLTDVNLAGSFIRCESKGKERIIPLYPAAVDALAVYMQLPMPWAYRRTQWLLCGFSVPPCPPQPTLAAVWNPLETHDAPMANAWHQFRNRGTHL